MNEAFLRNYRKILTTVLILLPISLTIACFYDRPLGGRADSVVGRGPRLAGERFSAADVSRSLPDDGAGLSDPQRHLFLHAATCLFPFSAGTNWWESMPF